MPRPPSVRHADTLIRRARDWRTFASVLEPLADKAKGDAFERLVQLYLRTAPTYRTQLRHVWRYDEVPAKVRQCLHLPPPDRGIDLIAEMKDGGFWAIQAKYRTDPRKALTLRDLATFSSLAYTTCRGIAYALVCTTTERGPALLERAHRPVGFQTSEVWQALGPDDFRQFHALLADRAPRLVPTKPRPHQRQAIKKAVAHYLEGKATRGKLILPCGTGKTLTAFWIAKALNARTVLVVVPSLALIRQTLTVWLRETLARREEVSWLAVCSDETAGEAEVDSFTAHTSELGAPCVTESAAIARWLKQRRPGWRVVFSTYQSGKALADGARRAGMTFDLGVYDEAHKTVGARTKAFAHLLSDKNVAVKRRVFMTATERRYRGESDEILSMDDPQVYGDAFEVLTFKQALETRPPILSDYRILVVGVSKGEVRRLITENAFVRPDRGRWTDVEARTLATVVALRRAMQHHPIRHAVTFHGSIKRARSYQQHQEALTAALPKWGTLETFHISSHLRTSERARELAAFAEARRGLITNARCLTEGVDLPNIDCVLFADPRRSVVDIVQATGRALRPAKGKRLGYVVVPMVIDEKRTPEKTLESDAFRDVLAVVRALATNDERIVEELQTITGAKRRGRIVTVDVPPEVLPKAIDLRHFVEAVELRTWDRVAPMAFRSFEEARRYARTLRLPGHRQYAAWSRGELPSLPRRPPDIPKAPHAVYPSQGWSGWGDFLGTGRRIGFRRFADARRFIRALRFRGQKEYFRWAKAGIPGKPARPWEIPSSPASSYASQGWKGWGDFLGTTGRRVAKPIPYPAAGDVPLAVECG